MRRPVIGSRRVRSQAQTGFSLLEVMVASTILGFTVSAVTIMVGNSDLLRLTNDHYRQSRIIAQEELEDPKHHYLNYANLGAAGLNQSITLDFNETNQDTTIATRSVLIFPEAQPDVFGDGVKIPFRTIRSTVTWKESGKSQTVTLYKRVVAVR